MSIEWPTDSNRSPDSEEPTTTEASWIDRSSGVEDTSDGGSDGGPGGPGPESSRDPSEDEVAVEDEGEMHRSAVDTVDALLDEVELALARLDDGTYGRCEECGETIDDGRLAARPIIRTCGRCDQELGTEPEPESGSGSPLVAPGITGSTAPTTF